MQNARGKIDNSVRIEQDELYNDYKILEMLLIYEIYRFGYCNLESKRV